jgi:hypothetical protein
MYAFQQLFCRDGISEIIIGREYGLLIDRWGIGDIKNLPAMLYANILLNGHIQINFGVRQKLAVTYGSHILEL